MKLLVSAEAHRVFESERHEFTREEAPNIFSR